MAESMHHLFDPLTDREMDVLRVMADGSSNQEIANRLHIAVATVKWYNAQIYSKLSVSNRHDAITRAHDLGLLEDDSEQQDYPHNLPQASTSFVGRTSELRDLHTLLHHDGTQLITIMAQGGMGKTRLALELAQYNLHHYSDGVYFIQLAPVQGKLGVMTAIANELGLQHYDESQDMQDNLLRYLSSQTMLIILDNFEHVQASATLVSSILAACPSLKIIVTSRERLRLQREIVYPLNGLTMTDNINDEAMQLFVLSTQRILPDYSLSKADAPHVQQICELVEGLPLGIELAAGWMDTLSPEMIASEIKKSLSILETDLVDIPERHRSIQATFAYTWERLSPDEQATMMTFSLFKGGITKDAAQTVALANVRVLRQLVNKSLLYHHPSERYSIHELLRQYCFDKLMETGDYDQVVTAYMRYFANYADQNFEPMNNFDGSAFRAIRADWDNIAYAWQKMSIYQHYDLIAKTCGSIWKFSSMQGHSYECVALFEPVIEQLQALDQPDATLKNLLSHLLIYYGDLLLGIKTLDIASTYIDAGITIAESLDEAPIVLLNAYRISIYSKYKSVSYETIKALADTLIKLAYQHDMPFFIINAYGALWFWDEFSQDDGAYQESLAICENIWDSQRQANPNNFIDLHHIDFVRLLIHLDRKQEAIHLLNQLLALYEQAEWLYGISGVRSQLMVFAHEVGNYQDYAKHVISILTWHKGYGRDWQTIGCLSGINGSALYYTGAYTRAVTICTFVKNHPLSVVMQKYEADRIIERCKIHLTDDMYQEAIEQAHKLTFQQAYEQSIAYWMDKVAEYASEPLS